MQPQPELSRVVVKKSDEAERLRFVAQHFFRDERAGFAGAVDHQSRAGAPPPHEFTNQTE